MKKINKSQIQQQWRLPYSWEIDDNGKWIHNTKQQKHRLRVLKIRNIIKYGTTKGFEL